MKFAIITHALHYRENERVYAYAPYVSEMNLWGRYVDEFLVVAPSATQLDTAINSAYEQNQIRWIRIPAFSLVGIGNFLRTLFVLPVIFIKVFRACAAADHIHLRCPGNVGLIGCVAQMFFPKKPKTAKYAGNWGSNEGQPWSYRFQKWLLANTFLTRNMQVLVYGDWPDQSKNIKSFFTATYSENEKEDLANRDYTGVLQFVFVGTLSPGKQPLWVAQFVDTLNNLGQKAVVDFYGDGQERAELEQYIANRGLEDTQRVHGNKPRELVKKQLQKAHFLLLPSRSEGWPKVVAEAMFWGCIPVVTPVSCVPWMLGNGGRGFLVSGAAEDEAGLFLKSIKERDLGNMRQAGANWSRNYTIDLFEKEIQKLI